MNDEEKAIEALAYAFAKRRWGSTVYMDGSTNPTPVDFAEARHFVRALQEAGWSKPDTCPFDCGRCHAHEDEE